MRRLLIEVAQEQVDRDTPVSRTPTAAPLVLVLPMEPNNIVSSDI
jgi:hypothetical protein